MSNGVHLLTGHKDTNHISAMDDAAVNAAMSTTENVIIADTKNVECSSTTSGTTGTITVTPFTALFSGRKIKAIEASATCTLPDSSTTYKHVSVGILYTKDTSDDTEDCDLIAYASTSVTANVNTAKTMSTGAPSNHTIGEETTEAYMELFDMVVNANGIVTSKTEKTYTIIPSMGSLKEQQDETAARITTLQSQQTTTSAELTALTSRVSSIETWRTSATNKLTNVEDAANTARTFVERRVSSVNSYYGYPISGNTITLTDEDQENFAKYGLCLLIASNGAVGLIGAPVPASFPHPWSEWKTTITCPAVRNNEHCLYTCEIGFASNSSKVLEIRDGRYYGRWSMSYETIWSNDVPFSNLLLVFFTKGNS